MRTRMKLLTVGLVLLTAAVAGCSNTTAGSSGAIQNDVTLPPSPSAASTAPTPSPDPVTPTAEPTEAPASPVASQTDSPSASESPQGPALLGSTPADMCDAGLPYSCGDLGQSGVGTVFYASTTPFACGTNMASVCNFLEVAPNRWNGKLENCPGEGTGLVQSSCGGSPNATSDWGSRGMGTGSGYSYCTGRGKNRVIPNASGIVVGSGFANTSAMLPECMSNDAGELARGYTGGGLSDWSLPSLDELTALYYYPNRNAIGGFADACYWSSYSYERDSADAYCFSKGSNKNKSKALNFGVRPVRAF